MCSLCGTLAGAVHWAEAGAYERGETGGRRLVLRDRLRRVELLNRVLRPWRLSVQEWEETAYVLHGPTGDTVLVHDLPSLWFEAARIAGRPLDPLDGAVLEGLGRR